jgi:lipoate-protein ligase A
VTNLKNRVNKIKDMEDFMTSMMNYFLLNIPDLQTYNISAEETETIRSLAGSKYKTWEWNYGYGPQYTFTSRIEVCKRQHQCRLVVKDGIIWECEIEGSDEMKVTGKKLIGCRHMYEDLLTVFHTDNIPIPDDEVYKFF